jgi:hypothetical protein
MAWDTFGKTKNKKNKKNISFPTSQNRRRRVNVFIYFSFSMYVTKKKKVGVGWRHSRACSGPFVASYQPQSLSKTGWHFVCSLIRAPLEGQTHKKLRHHQRQRQRSWPTFV